MAENHPPPSPKEETPSFTEQERDAALTGVKDTENEPVQSQILNKISTLAPEEGKGDVTNSIGTENQQVESQQHVEPVSESVTQRDQESGAVELEKKYKKIDFKEVFARVKMEAERDPEAQKAKFPWLNRTPKSVSPLVAAQFLEELYEEMARESDEEGETH